METPINHRRGEQIEYPQAHEVSLCPLPVATALHGYDFDL